MSNIPSWATPVDVTDSSEERLDQVKQGTAEIPSWATPITQDVSSRRNVPTPDPKAPSWAIPVDHQANTSIKRQIPRGIQAGTYTEDDLSQDPRLYNPIAKYVRDRYGFQAVEKKSREDIINTFLNDRRGNAAGNSVRIVSTVDYLMNAKEDPKRMAMIGDAFAIYEGMSGIFSDQATWRESASGLGDYVRTVLLDPINVVGGAIGRTAGGVTLKATARALEKAAQKEVASSLASGATREAAEKAGTDVLKKSIQQASVQNTKEVAEFAAKLQANKGLSRITTKAGIAEIGAAAFTDAVVNSGAEFLYQRSLIETGVTDELSKGAIGLAALGSMAIGGVQAGRVAARGVSGTTLISESVKQANPKQIAKELQQSINDYLRKGSIEESAWVQKVKNGEELTDADSDFFIDLLLGVSDKNGNVMMKGLAQTMQEGGYYYTKRSEDDKISNWLADFIADMDQDSVSNIIKGVEDGLGRKIKGLDNITPEDFSNAFAKKLNSSARNMNSVMQVARRMDISIADLKLDDFMNKALGLEDIDIPGLDKAKYAGKGVIGSNITETQNKFIRSLVSHPSTSALNVLGYGVASGLDTGTDIMMALYKGGRGTLKSVIGMQKAGMKDREVAMQLLLSSKDRIKFALDPDMTYAAYRSAMERQTGSLDKLNRTLAGGVDVSVSMKNASSLGGVGGKVQNAMDTYINGIQTATFVHAQDSLTKSQEYVSQMNKGLRTAFGKSWNEFYTDPNASRIMATKEYKQIEANAVSKTLENTFSKSYKGHTPLGEVAGMIEDARNVPGLGFMVPFGRFFNNTIDFGIKNTPLLNVAAKAGGKYADKEYSELMIRGAISAGLVYSLAQNEDEKRRQGLGLYDAIVDGQIVSQQYDYPLSLFVAAGRILSYNMAGEEVPEGIINQIKNDFLGGSLTRNLSKTTGEFTDFVSAILAGELEEAGHAGLLLSKDVTSQALSGFTRHLEPLDSTVGMFTGVDQRPKDVAQGNKFIGDSLRYIDTSVSLLTGKMDPNKVASYAGVLDQQTTKNLGVRTIRLTNTQRLMNMIGEPQWLLNSGLSKEKRLVIPESVNEYQRLVFETMEKWATSKMDNEVFRGMTQAQQRNHWDKKVLEVKQAARYLLATKYTGPQSTLSAQYNLYTKYKIEEIDEAIESLGIEKDIGDMSLFEVNAIAAEIKKKEYIDTVNIPSGSY